MYQRTAGLMSWLRAARGLLTHDLLSRTVLIGVIAVAGGCRGDLLGVPAPLNAVNGATLSDSGAASALAAGATGLFQHGIQDTFGWIRVTGEMSDEMFNGNAIQQEVALDARAVSATGPNEWDAVYSDLQKGRIQAEQVIAIHKQHPAVVPDSELASMFAVRGYIRVFLGEVVCSGIPFTAVTRTGEITFGDPLSSDSVFALAIVDFDSALAYANSTPTVANLARIGTGRALLSRGRYAEAASVVANVPATFVYSMQEGPQDNSLYENAASVGFFITVADRKGQNGLDYVSAHDPRMPTTLSGATLTGAPWIYPLKFPLNFSTNDPVPLADGVEAALITAEAALSAHDVNGWLGALNALRMNFVALRGPYPADTSYHQLQPLADPGSDSARTSLTFRERAFWMYGTGHRLGDLRRLIRWYGRDQSQVFPVGAYVNGTASNVRSTYGTNVSLPIGAVEQGNPKFHGCLSLGA